MTRTRLPSLVVGIVASLTAAMPAHATSIARSTLEAQVLEAELIVTGRVIAEGQLLVEEVLFGSARPSEQIAVRDLGVGPVTVFENSNDLQQYVQRAYRGQPLPPPDRSLANESVVLLLDRCGNVWCPVGIFWVLDGKIYARPFLDPMTDPPTQRLLIRNGQWPSLAQLSHEISEALKRRPRYEVW